MIYRCENPKYQAYKYYGAKGIKVCEEWKKDYEIEVHPEYLED